MPVAKKERTGHKCLWQRRKDQTTNDGGKRKIAALIRQASKRKMPALIRQANEKGLP